ncbi:hypothetical protein Gpo141_00006771 [Globisporangium polare]
MLICILIKSMMVTSNEPTIEPAAGFSDSFVRRQLLSDSDESFDGSVSVGSADGGTAGDRGRLYIQKIHERLRNFAGRSSASSSVAQYSLPLSDSMSSISESFHDHLAAGYGDDSFIHNLVPMFSAPGILAIEQMNSEGNHEIHEQYDIQLVDPALSRMLGDSLYSRRSSHAPSQVPPNADTRDVVHDETEAPLRRFEQWTIDEQGAAGVVMEQHSLLSDSGSGVSSAGFTALLHLTAGTTRSARDDDAEREALESEEKVESDHLDRRAPTRFSSDSSLGLAGARFNYLASMTAAVGESLPLHLRLPAMIYGNEDMSAPPRPINWARSSSSLSASRYSDIHKEKASFEREECDQQGQKSIDPKDNRGGEERSSDRATDMVGSGQERASSSRQSSGDSDDSEDKMQYEAFRRGLMEGKMGSLPPPPFGNMDMSRPPPPLVRPQASSGSQRSSSSSRSSSHSSAASIGQANRDRSEEELVEEDKRHHDEDDSRDGNSFFSEASASAASRGERRKGGESLFISVGSDEGEEQKEEDTGRAVSLADAFRQRHPRFRERVKENREQQRQKRQELQSLQQQQQEKENTRRSNVTLSRKQVSEAAQAATKDESGADLTEEQQRLLDRLAVGERAQVSAQEMKERTRRNYQKLPEVVERKRQEEILRRRKQRLAELREQEKARRLQQKLRREQQKQRDEANN